VTAPLAVFDVGSTLVEGPARGPASRIAAALGIDATGKRELQQILMTSDCSSPQQLCAVVDERLGLGGAAVTAAVTEVWDAQQNEAHPVPGAARALDSFVAHGWRLALLSNIWPPYLQSVRRLFGDFFDEHIPAGLQLFSCREGVAKPAPELFRRVLERAEVSPGAALMVGDSYGKDIEPAAAVGMRTLWLVADPARDAARIRKDAASAATLTLRSLADLDLDGAELARPPSISTAD